MSGIDNAKKMSGWQPPNERSGCYGCRHATTENTGFYDITWRCERHGFITQRYAICTLWAAREVRGA
jgi:hypothetical protein